MTTLPQAWQAQKKIPRIEMVYTVYLYIYNGWVYITFSLIDDLDAKKDEDEDEDENEDYEDDEDDEDSDPDFPKFDEYVPSLFGTQQSREKMISTSMTVHPKVV